MSISLKLSRQDYGFEISGLTVTLQNVVEIYFSHPDSSREREARENQHKLISRFIPKGTTISKISDDQIILIQRCMNEFPRKVLNYQTPHDLFTKGFKQKRKSACSVRP